jgi:hypothetical protein
MRLLDTYGPEGPGRWPGATTIAGMIALKALEAAAGASSLAVAKLL